jgi:hypothetical protein
VAVAIAIVAVLFGAVVVTTTQLFEARDQRNRARFQSRRVDYNQRNSPGAKY